MIATSILRSCGNDCRGSQDSSTHWLLYNCRNIGRVFCDGHPLSIHFDIAGKFRHRAPMPAFAVCSNWGHDSHYDRRAMKVMPPRGCSRIPVAKKADSLPHRNYVGESSKEVSISASHNRNSLEQPGLHVAGGVAPSGCFAISTETHIACRSKSPFENLYARNSESTCVCKSSMGLVVEEVWPDPDIPWNRTSASHDCAGAEMLSRISRMPVETVFVSICCNTLWNRTGCVSLEPRVVVYRNDGNMSTPRSNFSEDSGACLENGAQYDLEKVPEELRDCFEEIEIVCGAPYERIVEKANMGDWHPNADRGHDRTQPNRGARANLRKHETGAVNGTAKWAKEHPQSSGARVIANVAEARSAGKLARMTAEKNGDPVNSIAKTITHDQPFPAPATLGWRATCSHPLFPQAEPIPCTVLDPFGGSGTTAVVAERLGRHAILIDRNEDYLEMAEFRLQQARQNVRSAYAVSRPTENIGIGDSSMAALSKRQENQPETTEVTSAGIKAASV